MNIVPERGDQTHAGGGVMNIVPERGDQTPGRGDEHSARKG